MTPVFLLAIVIGVPIIVGILFRVNPVYMYLSLLIGKVLLTFVGDDAAVAAAGFIKSENSQLFSSLFLLFIPLLLTTMILKGTLHKKQVPAQLPAFIAVGISLYIFTLPQLSSGVQGNILSNEIGKTINTSQDLIIAASALIILIMMWLNNRTHSAHKKLKHHK